MQDSYREQLLWHVKKLVSNLDGNELSEKQLETKFEKKWIECMQDFNARVPKVHQQSVNIDISVERCLRELFRRKQDKQIIGKLSRKPLREWGKPLQVVVQPDTHLQSSRWWGLKAEDVEYAQRKTNSFLQIASQYLQDLKKRRIQNFSDGFIHGLFQNVYRAVNQFNQEKNNFKFTFTQLYQVDIALTVGGYMLYVTLKKWWKLSGRKIIQLST